MSEQLSTLLTTTLLRHCGPSVAMLLSFGPLSPGGHLLMQQQPTPK